MSSNSSRWIRGFALVLIASCNGAKDGSTTLVRLDPEPAGANCPHGGTAIRIGIDTNGDRTLGDAEVTSTSYVCNGGDGAAGPSTLVRLDPELAGAHCASGGTAVHAGFDANRNGVLDDAEIASTTYVCAPDAALVRVDVEPPGTNCKSGGVAVRAGSDTNGNGVLDDPEITSTGYVCNPALDYKDGILVLQPGADFIDPGYVSLIDRGTKALVWTAMVSGMPRTAIPDPDRRTFWLSVEGGGVEHRALADGSLLTTVPYSTAKDMALAPTLHRLYVGGYESIGVIDIVTGTLVTTIPLQMYDQTLGVAVSPDDSEVVVGSYLGTHDLVFVSTATNTITQRLVTANYFTDVMHFGTRVVTWDDNNDEVRAYAPAPWAEIPGSTLAFGADAGASMNAFHTMQYDPVDARIYISQAVTARVVRFDPFDTSTYTGITLANPYLCTVLDLDGLGLIGFAYPATATPMHLGLPAGPETTSSYATGALPLASCTDLENVSYAVVVPSL